MHGSCFKLFPETMEWNAAKSFCLAIGTNLTILNSKDKTNVVTSKIENWGWIGLHRDPKNGSRWFWINGSLSNYTNWGSDQPNYDVGDVEDCVATKAKEKWHDWSCRTSFRPICELSRK